MTDHQQKASNSLKQFIKSNTFKIFLKGNTSFLACCPPKISRNIIFALELTMLATKDFKKYTFLYLVALESKLHSTITQHSNFPKLRWCCSTYSTQTCSIIDGYRNLLGCSTKSSLISTNPSSLLSDPLNMYSIYYALDRLILSLFAQMSFSKVLGSHLLTLSD